MEEMTWEQLPADGGQIVDVRYAVDWEAGRLYRRRHDRSDGTVTMEMAPVTGGEFAPQNGLLPTVADGSWADCGV